MSVINSKKNIPTVGDTVEKVVLSTNKKYIQITFSKGSKLVASVNPDEMVRGYSKPSIPVKAGLPPVQKPIKTENKKIDAMTKNTPSDQDYQNRVLASLAKMDGKTPEEVKEILESNQPQMSGTIGSPQVATDNDWKEKAAAALEKSQNRATRLSEQFSASHGGKTDASFGGKNSLEMK